MATLAQYVTEMEQRQVLIARQLGSDVTMVDKQTRAINTSMLVMVATLMKTLVDQGVITDAQLLATLNAAIAATWPDLPV